MDLKGVCWLQKDRHDIHPNPLYLDGRANIPYATLVLPSLILRYSW